MKYIRFSVPFGLAFLTFVGFMSLASAQWVPGKGVLWVEYREMGDPAGRYTPGMYFGRSGHLDTATGLSWATADQTSTPWTNAGSYCTGLGSGWRLPHIKELNSLVSATKTSAPYTDLPNTVSTYYWSSTAYAPSTSYAWSVGFSNGSVSNGSKTHSRQVVCVHD